MRLIHELRAKYPNLAKLAERGPVSAIRLFCLECTGGNRAETRSCTTTECCLHPFRMGHRPHQEAQTPLEDAKEPTPES